MNRIQRVIKAAGGNKEVAKKIGSDTGIVWRKAGFGGEEFADNDIITICEMTDGLIAPSKIRPHLSSK